MKLTIHVGLGKTGTSAVQTFLDSETEDLKVSGIFYTGVNMEHLHSGFSIGSQGDVASVELLSSALAALEEDLSARSDITHAFWSNEALSMNYNYPAVAQCIGAFARNSRVFDSVTIVLVLRRQDDWIESAYRQWALKHKMHQGRTIMSIDDYIDTVADFLDYLSVYRTWAEVGTNPIRVVSYDDVRYSGGMVRYVVDYLGLPWRDRYKIYENVHPSFGSALSYLNATFNSTFEGEVLPNEFGDMIAALELPELSERNSALLSAQMRRHILDLYSHNNTRVAKEALQRDELFSTGIDSSLTTYDTGQQDVIRYLTVIAQRQFNELQKLKGEILALSEIISKMV